jgi:hypothetical protein
VLPALLALVLALHQPVDDAAGALRSDPVYVDPAAERALSDAEAEELRESIRDAGEAVFVAVLPASAAPTDAEASALPRQLEAATGLAGDYVVVAGDRFRAEDGARATAAFQAARDGGLAAVLEAYVAPSSSGAGDGAGGDGRSGSDNGAGSSLLPLAILGAGGVGVFAWARRRRRRELAEAQAEFDADVQVLRAELSVLSEDVLRLEPEVRLHPQAQPDYDAATQRARAASAALDYADEPVDLVRVARVVDEAGYAMSRARAVVGGYEPPPPPAELRRPGRHDEPPVDVDDEGRVVYAGGMPFYGGGWFGAGGGLFSGLLLGSVLGGWGWGGWGGGDVYVDSDPGGWGGDIGGGDFGGDIGGGDF